MLVTNGHMFGTEGRNMATTLPPDHDIFVDPVSHEPVHGKGAAKSFYNRHMYHFTTIVNKKTFDDCPQLWISTPHGSMNSANISISDE